MEQLLKKHFGYEKFRPMQKEIVDSVLNKKDCLVLMPTGGGKSMCYQFPAVNLPGITIVISPLISLMKDQVDSLNENGIQARFINSSLSAKEISEIQENIHKIKLLYIAPERLASKGFEEFLKNLNVSLIAVDEAHCISQWGHNFRPEYRNLNKLKNFFPQASIIALTATATPKVRQDILEQLDLHNPEIFISSFNRENLNLMVFEKKKIENKILRLLKEHKNESAIIYCFSRRDVERLSEFLNDRGFNALPYHAGLNGKTRKLNQDLFIQGRADIIVATIAFGMGIDKPDIRLIIHQTFPKSLEGYYQEIGRAGRDGLESDCVLFYSRGDLSKHRYFINKLPNIEERKKEWEKIRGVLNYCEISICRRHYLLDYFGEKFPKECSGCDICGSAEDKKKLLEGYTFIKKTDYDKKLFEKLRNLRKEISFQRKVPSYAIFGDSALKEMAIQLPKNTGDFSKIKGVGEKKLKDYGNPFLNIINNHLKEKNKEQEKEINKALTGQLKKCENTRRGVFEKKFLYDMAKEQGLSASTIIDHINKLLSAGIKLDIDYLLPEKKDIEKIKKAFEKFGIEKLSPVYVYFDSLFTYETLKLVRCKIIIEDRGY
ncbi:MAG: RecQ family ATP-dependent DNA helicase [Nanoarchaeota archaeon]